MISSESLNLLLPNLVCWCIIMSQIVFQKDWVAVFKGKVTVKDHITKMWLSHKSNMSFELLIHLQLLGLMAHHDKLDCLQLDCLVKRLDCFVVVKVKGSEKVHNSSECSSWQYLLNCWTFCNQTCYCDASSWARVSCKKIGCCLQVQGHSEG